MSQKWADWLISAVSYNAAGTHIESVKIHEDKGDKVGTAVTVPREEVVRLLGLGQSASTIVKGEGSNWIRGAEVRAVVIDGQTYIRTDADATKADNLGKLPTF